MSTDSKSHILHSLFSTEKLRQQDKEELYQENMGMVFDVKYENTPPNDLYAIIQSFLIDEIMLIDCQTFGQYFFRHHSKIAKDGLDHILMQYFICGSTESLEKKYSHRANPTNIIFIDTARPWKAINPDFHNLTLVIPRRLFIQNDINPSLLHGLVLEMGNNPLVKVLINYFCSIKNHLKLIESRYSPALMKTLVELTVTTLKCHFENSSQSLKDSKTSSLLSINQFIDRSILLPDLNVSLVTDEFKLSNAELSNLYPDNIGGLEQYIKLQKYYFTYRFINKNGYNKDTLGMVSSLLGISHFEYLKNFKTIFDQHPRDAAHLNQISKHKLNEHVYEEEFLWHQWYKAL